MPLWTEDAFCGKIRQATNLPSACLDSNFVNPQTGPFSVKGAEPGDTLVLHLVDLEPLGTGRVDDRSVLRRAYWH